MKIVFAALLLLPLSCQHFVNDGSREFELDDTDGKKTHVLSYNPGGFEFIVEIRRKGAIEVMEKKCGQDGYEILSEETDEPGRDAGRTVDSIGAGDLRYVQYICNNS